MLHSKPATAKVAFLSYDATGGGIMMKRMLIAALAAVFMLAVTAVPASAFTPHAGHVAAESLAPASNPKPKCGKGFVVVVVKGKAQCQKAKPKAPAAPQICKTQGNVTTCVSSPYVTIGPKKVSAQDMASGRIWIGSDVRLKGTQYKSPKCRWTKGGFKNSMLVNGKLEYYWDPIPAKLCPNKNSPTGEVKVAGGTTGRDCGNPATTGKAPKPLLKGTIINVRSMANVWLPMHAKVSVVVDDRANGCYASASASALTRIRLITFVRARGKVNIGIFANVFAKLETKASASTDCKPVVTPPGVPPTPPVPPPPPPCCAPPPPPPPPPANRPPTVQLVCPQHVYSHRDPTRTGRAVIWAYVNDPDGDPLNLGFTRPQYGTYNGGAYPHPTEAGRWGVEYQAPVWTGPGDLMETITVVVTDSRGGRDTKSCTFPIKPDQF